MWEVLQECEGHGNRVCDLLEAPLNGLMIDEDGPDHVVHRHQGTLAAPKKRQETRDLERVGDDPVGCAGPSMTFDWPKE